MASSFVITFVTALFREYRLLTNWATQIREHGPLAYRTAWRILGHAQDTEDVVQEAFVEMFRIGLQREILNWAGLLRTTVTCRALDRLRKNRKFSPLPDDLASRPGDSPDHAAESAELVAWLRSAIAELPPRQAEVFSLRHFAEMSNGEIAAALKISPEAVAVALNKARTTLAASRVPR